MERDILEDLKNWKAKNNKKPLIIQGARQVGKTWIMKEFGKTEYKESVYLNFDNNSDLNSIFNNYTDTKRVIQNISIYINREIDIDNTLLIFDEIQECPNALTSLKYFYENAQEYNIICAGRSLLGITLHANTSFPVGKVEFLNLYPMNFYEFLKACGDYKLLELIKSHDYENIKIFHNKIVEKLKYYFYIGGMPEVVLNYIKTKNIIEVRDLQNEIINSYSNDFSKHVPIFIIQKLRLLWESIPQQLSKENKKFVYKDIKEGARAREFENAMMWLNDAGLIYKVNKILKPHLPLKAYQELSFFKLFMLDIGLVSAFTGLELNTLINKDKIFVEFKGALTEQFVLQELKTLKNIDIFYWGSEKSIAEIDFLIQEKNNIIPIEVKSSINLKAKSMRVYNEKYNPDICIRTSLANFKTTNNLFDLPLYMIAEIKNISEKDRQ